MDAREELFQTVYPLVLRQIEQGAKPTPVFLRDSVAAFASPVMLMNPGLVINEADAAAVARRIETLIDVVLDAGIVVEKGYEAWLDRRRLQIQPFYWERYRTWLGQEGLPPAVVAEIGAGTDRVLDLLRDPHKDGSWDRRGLVVGNVQSGKTAHYTGLVAKAADAGYRVIIIIAGIHNNLRNQTQGRIDEGFIGEHRVRERSSVRRELIGVGRINPDRRPVGLTSSNQDFTKATADAMGFSFGALAEPAVFVIKKNPTTLRNLIEWLRPPVAGQTIDAPLLLIDDEADNASINVAYSKNEISVINGRIRELLDLFGRSAYVGYTATPFANIFIDPVTEDQMVNEDLFPRSFIVSLDAPSNYLGARRVFLEEPESFLRWIDDAEDILPTRHKKDHVFVQVPDSLVDAIRAFVLTRAVRIIRGDGARHSSMLINASRFVGVQTRIRNHVVIHLEAIRDSARLHHALPEEKAITDPGIAALQRVFFAEFADTGVSWHDVLAQLWEASAPIKVVAVNSKSSDNLHYDDYPKGLHVIAIGGLALSRGLTLEGLSTTYFLRNSQMYDTLLQMGRWFGYRPQYEDLCRIWIPEEVAGWYAHIAESVDELREELRRMAADGRSPEEFGLKVRSHPATLIVTARNKMGAGETRTVRIGLALRNIQVRALSVADREANIAAGARLIGSLQGVGRDAATLEPVTGGLLVRDVPLELVRRFLIEFRNNSYSMLTDPEAVLSYIDGRTEEMELWDLFLAQLRDEGDGGISDVIGLPLRIRSRTVDERQGRVEFRKANFLDPNDEKVGLNDQQIEAAELSFRSHTSAHEGKYNYPAVCYREERTRPQLGLHLLHLKVGGENRGDLPQPWLAWNISFPGTARANETTEYVVNAIWLADYLTNDVAEDGDLDDD